MVAAAAAGVWLKGNWEEFDSRTGKQLRAD